MLNFVKPAFKLIFTIIIIPQYRLLCTYFGEQSPAISYIANEEAIDKRFSMRDINSIR